MATSKRILRTDIGAWIFKANPSDEWDYFEELKDRGLHSGSKTDRSWAIGTNYRTELVKPGDLVVLWVSGPVEPGAHELGIVSGPITVEVLDEDYLINERRRGKHEWFAPFTSYVLPRPISRNEFKQHPVLGASEVIRAPQMGNPTYLSPSEYDAFVELVGSTDLAKAGWPHA